jgi:hypothetical protein
MWGSDLARSREAGSVNEVIKTDPPAKEEQRERTDR